MHVMPSFFSKVFGRKSADDKEHPTEARTSDGTLLDGKFEVVSPPVSPTALLFTDGEQRYRASKEKESRFTLFRLKHRTSETTLPSPKSAEDVPHLTLNLPDTAENASPALDPDARIILPDDVVGDKRLNTQEALRLIQACSQWISERGLETLGIMHPHWYSSSPDVQRRLISLFILSLHSRTPTTTTSPSSATPVSAFETELNFTRSPHDVAAVLRWGLRHFKLDGLFGRGSSEWDWYKAFYEAERSASYPHKAFKEHLTPLIPKDHLDLLNTILEVISFLASHSETNGISGSKLSKLFGLWLLSTQRLTKKDDWMTFYLRWERAGRILEHLFLARIRDEAVDHRMPKRLLELVKRYPYASGVTNTNDDLLPRPRVSTQQFDAILVRLEVDPSTPSSGRRKHHPLRLISEALKLGSSPDAGQIGALRLWDKIKAAAAKAEAEGVSPMQTAPALSPIFADETAQVLSLLPPDHKVPEAPPTFTILIPTPVPRRARHERRRSMSLSAAASPVSPANGVASVALNSHTPPDRSPSADWTTFSNTGFGGETTQPLASTLLDKDLEKTKPTEPFKLSKKIPLPQRRSSADAPAPPVVQPKSEEPQPLSKVSSVSTIQLDEAFIDFWSDALLDPISSNWPEFVICKLKPIPGLESGGNPISWLIIEKKFNGLSPLQVTQHLSPVEPTTRTSSVRPSSPRPSFGSQSRKRFSFFSSRRNSTSSEKAAKKKGSPKANELGEILPEVEERAESAASQNGINVSPKRAKVATAAALTVAAVKVKADLPSPVAQPAIVEEPKRNLADKGLPYLPEETTPKPEGAVQPSQQSAKLIPATNGMTGSEQLPSDVPSLQPDSAGMLPSIPDVQPSDVVAQAQMSAEARNATSSQVLPPSDETGFPATSALPEQNSQEDASIRPSEADQAPKELDVADKAHENVGMAVVNTADITGPSGADNVPDAISDISKHGIDRHVDVNGEHTLAIQPSGVATRANATEHPTTADDAQTGQSERAKDPELSSQPVGDLVTQDLGDLALTARSGDVDGTNAQPADSVVVSHVEESQNPEEHSAGLQSTRQGDSSAESSDTKAAQQAPEPSLTEGRVEVAPTESEKAEDVTLSPVASAETREAVAERDNALDTEVAHVDDETGIAQHTVLEERIEENPLATDEAEVSAPQAVTGVHLQESVPEFDSHAPEPLSYEERDMTTETVPVQDVAMEKEALITEHAPDPEEFLETQQPQTESDSTPQLTTNAEDVPEPGGVTHEVHAAVEVEATPGVPESLPVEETKDSTSSEAAITPHEPVGKTGDEEATLVTAEVEATELAQETPSHAERTKEDALPEMTIAPSDHVEKISGTSTEEEIPAIVEAEATEPVQEPPHLVEEALSEDKASPETATEQETSVVENAEAMELAQEPHPLVKEVSSDAEKAEDSVSPEIVPQDTVEETGGASTLEAPTTEKAVTTEAAHESSLLVKGTPPDAEKANGDPSPETTLAPRDLVEETPVFTTTEAAEPAREPPLLVKEAPLDAEKATDNKSLETTTVSHGPEEEISGVATEEASALAQAEATKPTQESPLPVKEPPLDAEAKDGTSPETIIVSHDPVEEDVDASTEEETSAIAKAEVAESAREPLVEETSLDPPHDLVEKVGRPSTEGEVPVVVKAEATEPVQELHLPDKETPSDVTKDNTSPETAALHHDPIEEIGDASTEEDMPVIAEAEATEPAQELPLDKEIPSDSTKVDPSPETAGGASTEKEILVVAESEATEPAQELPLPDRTPSNVIDDITAPEMGALHHDAIEKIDGASAEEEMPVVSKAEVTEPAQELPLPGKEAPSDTLKDNTSPETAALHHDPIEKVGSVPAEEEMPAVAKVEATEPAQEPPLPDKESPSDAIKDSTSLETAALHHDPIEKIDGASTEEEPAVTTAEAMEPVQEPPLPDEETPSEAEKAKDTLHDPVGEIDGATEEVLVRETLSDVEKAKGTLHEEIDGAPTEEDGSPAPEGSGERVPPHTEEEAQPPPVVSQDPVPEPPVTGKNLDAEAAHLSDEGEQKQRSPTSPPDAVERSIKAEDVTPTINPEESATATSPDNLPDMQAHVGTENEGNAEDSEPPTTDGIKLPDSVHDAPKTEVETVKYTPSAEETLPLEGEDISGKVHADNVLETPDAAATNGTNEKDG